MPSTSTELRAKAAAALRESRQDGRPAHERQVDRQVAGAYKGLADNQDWLESSAREPE